MASATVLRSQPLVIRRRRLVGSLSSAIRVQRDIFTLEDSSLSYFLSPCNAMLSLRDNHTDPVQRYARTRELRPVRVVLLLHPRGFGAAKCAKP